MTLIASENRKGLKRQTVHQVVRLSEIICQDIKWDPDPLSELFDTGAS
jgi:hypothetical protein